MSGALSSRPFRRFWLGQALSSLGDRMAVVALTFAVLESTGSVTAVGLVLGAGALASVAGLLFGGVWADRLGPRRAMLLADAVRCGVQAAAGLLLVAGAAPVWALVALQLVFGGAQSLFDPASSAMAPTLVGRDQLQSANGLWGIQRNVAVIAGPALAAAFVGSVGGGWALVADSGTYLVNAVTLWSLPRGRPRPVPAGAVLRELRSGWRAFVAYRWLWSSVLCFSAFVGVVVGPLQVLGAAQSVQRLGGAGSWAWVLGAQGAGSVLGGLASLRVRPARPLRAGFASLLVTWPAFLVALAVPAPLPAVMGLAVLAGGALSLFAALWTTTLQSRVSPDLLSRVSSYDWLGTKAVLPVGLALSGPLVALLGARGALLAVAVWCAATTAATLAVREVRELRGVTAD